jgi:hypothetical protein
MSSQDVSLRTTSILLCSVPAVSQMARPSYIDVILTIAHAAKRPCSPSTCSGKEKIRRTEADVEGAHSNPVAVTRRLLF